MDTSQWMQEEVGSAAKSILGGPNDATCTRSERKVVTRPQKEVNCPRCHSTNTKFCYYNNYSLTQPRYFCKTCRRYWTQGGTLRSVPVGGGSRKNNKKSTSTIHSLSMATDQSHKLPDLNPHPDHISLHDQGQGGNRGLRHHVGINVNPPHFPKFESRDHHVINTSTSSPASFSTLDFLKNGIAASGVNAQANTKNHNVHFAPSFPFNDQECHKPALAFTFDGVNVMSRRSLYGNSIDAISQHESLINGNTRVFPFGVTKQNSNTNEDDQQVKVTQENLNGYWIHNGMLGGGSW